MDQLWVWVVFNLFVLAMLAMHALTVTLFANPGATV